MVELGRRYLELCWEDGARLQNEKLQGDLARVRKRLGGLQYQQVSDMMAAAFLRQWQDGDLCGHRHWIALLLEKYYDPMYEYQLSKRTGQQLFRGDRQAVIAWAQQGRQGAG